MSRDEGLNGATALSERRPAARHRMERQERVHGRVEGRGPRSPQGREVEHRRRRPGRFAGSWGRAPGRSRLPDRFLSLLGKAARAKGLRVWTFGENFTVEGLPDDEVCIGDRYRIGSALFEVTQPRVTCYRVGIRTNEPQMAALLTSSGRPGFYLRVLQEGEAGAGDEIVKEGEAKER